MKATRKREVQRALWVSEPVTNEVIMRAVRKPKGVSAVRWRIELRRRANAKYFAECGSPVSFTTPVFR